jgi:predicted transcriptional regulator
VNEVRCQVNVKQFLISLQEDAKRGEAMNESENVCKHINIDGERKPSGIETKTDVHAIGRFNYLPKCE